MTNHSIDNIVKELLDEIIPEYKQNHNLALNFGFLFAFSAILIMVFGYLSYHFFFNISVILLTIFGLLTFYFYNKFGLTKQKFYSLYSDFEWNIESILEMHGNDISKSMLIWFFIIESPIENNIFSSLLLNTMKHDINNTDYYGNTILHHFLSHNINENIIRVYISHAILNGANLDIKNDKSITPRFLLSQKYPEYLSTIEQLEIIKSFKE